MYLAKMQYLHLSDSCLKKSSIFNRRMDALYYHTEILHIAEVLPNRLYFGIVEGDKALKNTEDTVFFNVDNELIYLNYYYDFGPLNISCLYKYCNKLNNYLSMPTVKRVVHYTMNDPNRKANGAYLMGSFAVLYLQMDPREVYRILLAAGGIFRAFVDASQGASVYTIRLTDCLQALEKAQMFNFFDFDDFNVGEYDTHDKLQNGDMNWIVPRKFLAFIGPTDGEIMTTHSPDFYLAYFIKNDIRTVIRLNNKVYNAEVFKQVGIDHYELFFQDGSVPPKAILKQFLNIAENAPAAVAVHCKAGLGRTGSLIGAYIIKHYKMTAREAIAWMRICRPGSVIGQQQAWLEKIEGWLWRQGNNYRTENFGDGDKIPHHRYGIYSIEWQQEREKLRKQSRMKHNPELQKADNAKKRGVTKLQAASKDSTSMTKLVTADRSKNDPSTIKNHHHSLSPPTLAYPPVEKLNVKYKYLSTDNGKAGNIHPHDQMFIVDGTCKICKPGSSKKIDEDMEETQGDRLNSIKAKHIANILPNSNLNKYMKNVNIKAVTGTVTLSKKKDLLENLPPTLLSSNNGNSTRRRKEHTKEHVFGRI